MESRLAAFPKIDKFLGDRFQYSIHEAERFGQETALQAFHLHGQESIYVSGRLLVRNFEEFLEKGFHFVTMIGEPYQELADRMLLFRRLAAMPERALGERDRMILGLAIEHFAEVDIDSDRALKRALRHLQPAVKRVLTAPLTRQLVATYPEQAATRASLAAAMDTLSRFTVVGLVEHPETFTAPLGELLELDPLDIPAPAAHPETTALAERLRRLHDAELLLELDLILYHFARETVLRYREWPAQDATRSANSPN